MPFVSRAKQNRKIEGCEYRYCTNFDWHYLRFEIVWFEFTKIKGAKIILHAKSPTFRAATLKVLQYPVLNPKLTSQGTDVSTDMLAL